MEFLVQFYEWALHGFENTDNGKIFAFPDNLKDGALSRSFLIDGRIWEVTYSPAGKLAGKEYVCVYNEISRRFLYSVEAEENGEKNG